MWREQPGIAVEVSGAPVGLLHCYEAGGFLGETWVAFTPIVFRDPRQELSTSLDLPTVETVLGWWTQAGKDPNLVRREDGNIMKIDSVDNQRYYWLEHLFDTSAIRVEPPLWVDLQRIVDRDLPQTADSGRPIGRLARAWGFPFRSVIERADLHFRDRRWIEGGLSTWYAPDWEVLAYDGIRIEIQDEAARSDTSLGIAIRPLWTGALLNSAVYALALWCAWRVWRTVRSIPRFIHARRS